MATQVETTDYVIIHTVISGEFAGRNRVRDASGEVQYFPTIDSAIEEALELTDRCKSDIVSYTVEASK